MLRLRPFKIRDAEKICSWFLEEEAFEKWSAGKFHFPLSAAQLCSFAEENENNDACWQMTAVDASGNVVGHFAVKEADYEKENAYLGYIVVSSQERGKGYGTEMIHLALSYVFDVLHMKTAILRVFDNNPAAIACYEKCGFKKKEYNPDWYTCEFGTWGSYLMEAAK